MSLLEVVDNEIVLFVVIAATVGVAVDVEVGGKVFGVVS